MPPRSPRLSPSCVSGCRIWERFPLSPILSRPAFASSTRSRVFLKNASVRRSLVLILEDLNWADDGSLLLLEFVARELADAHVLLIGTYRDIDLSRRHPLAKTLGELARERLFERVLLGGLSPRTLNASSTPPARSCLTRLSSAPLHTQTEGNPFFLSEVVRLLTGGGGADA